MDLCQRINAPFDQLLEIVRRLRMRKPHGRLHGRQDVLCSMLGFAREIDDLSLASFALRYILEAVDGTYKQLGIWAVELVLSGAASAISRSAAGFMLS
jgi:hypothetical protein